MVEQVVRLDATFTALADPTRRDILRRLSLGELSVGDLADPYEMSLNAVSKHLKVLEGAQLIRRRVEGRTHHISLRAEPLSDAVTWLEFYRGFWEGRLDALEVLLAKRKGKRR
ncbi:MAG: metalloregulator ArsR/SmtB family transcription factor [Myxococcales bacterium]